MPYRKREILKIQGLPAVIPQGGGFNPTSAKPSVGVV
jgi:hypothetical protein